MKRFLSLTLVAIMLFSTLTLTSCVLPKELRGGFIDILYNVAASVLGEYEINEAQWEKAMAQTNYTVQWNVSPKHLEEAPWLNYYYVEQTDGLRCEHFQNELEIGNLYSTLYAKNGDVYYKYMQTVGDEVIFQGELTNTLDYYCLGYLTQSPLKTLAQETFLEGVKFEALEFDGVSYYYKTTLFGDEIEYSFSFRFGSLYRMDAGWLINVKHVGVTDVYDYSKNVDVVNEQLDYID